MAMTVIERAEKRLEEEAQRERTMYLTGRESNTNDLLYWAAYLDGARAQKRETIEKWHEVCLDGRVKEAEHE